jgi:ABC-2 type transport system ATP-binding protein
LHGRDDISALEFTGVFKHFGDNVAVDHIDLRVPAGSFFGLVGPNGAGKTTSLSMAVGLLRPDGGTAKIFGHDMWADPLAAKALIGVLPDGMALPDRLSGQEILLYLGLLRGMPREVIIERSAELLQVLELDSAGGTAVVDYSTGMRKKITLATALLHSPRLLVLDEPFEAVDPVSAATIRAILQRFVAGGGQSVLFSRPRYQDGVRNIVGRSRGVPDISMSAACSGAVDVYQSFPGEPTGWYPSCGTSEATPLFAGIVALADQVARHPIGLINPALYEMSAWHLPGIVDVTSGNNTVSFTQNGQQSTVQGFSAQPGYSLVAGVGTVNGALFVPELAALARR